MSLATMRFQSRALGRHVSYSVILPEQGQGPYPVLIQLHGYGDDHTSWLYQSNLLQYLTPLPMIVLLPDGATSYYLDLELMPDSTSERGLQRYETFLIQDLREHATKFLPVQEGRWGIGGLSMGGFGAMRLGCKYPELFASIWAHSGAYYTRAELIGKVPNLDDADIYKVLEQFSHTPQKMEISFDCGLEDSLIEHNRRLHEHMQQYNIAHHYYEHEGGHTWDYWNRYVKDALSQHMRVFYKKSNDT